MSSWTKEEIHEIAKKYPHRSHFMHGDRTAYNAALKAKCMDEVCSHMTYLTKPKGYWTRERILAVLKDKFDNDRVQDDLASFAWNYSGGYFRARSLGMRDEIRQFFEDKKVRLQAHRHEAKD